MHKLQESGEMYLETILVLSLKGGCVRSIDVAEYLGYSKPSVSRGIGILKTNGYVIMEDDGSLLLTPKGKEAADKIYARHLVLTNLLVSFGVGEDAATRDACRMEHYISDESFNAIKKYVEGK